MKKSWFLSGYNHSLIAFCMLFVVLFAMMFSDLVYGQPNIVRASGDWSNGLSVTIIGDNFGIKSPAAPVLWDPVGGLPAYSRLSHLDVAPTQNDDDCPDCPWPARSIYGEAPKYFATGTELRAPGRAVYRVHKSGVFVDLQLNLSATNPVLYVNWWHMATKNLYDQGMGSVANKTIRIWSSKSGEQGRTSFETKKTMGWIDAEDPRELRNWYYGYPFTPNEWTNLEATVYSKNIDSKGGGRVTFDADHNRIVDTGPEIASSSGAYDYIPQIGSAPNMADRYETGTYVFWGDIYVDNTVARVMVGNASTYSACTHTEIQIPVNWRDGEIVFTGNLGSFQPGDSAWLYVFDSANRVNSTGFSIDAFGEPPMGPGQPGTPEVNP
jgi:hypothetical protein